MRHYINQIDPAIVSAILTEDELARVKAVSKAFSIANNAKISLEIGLRDKFKGAVVGELEGVKINYMAYTDTAYIAYTEESDVITPAKTPWWQFWETN